MRRWLRRVEQRVASLYVVNVVHAEVGVLEQVRSLRIDLEDVLVTEKFRIEPLSHSHYCIPTDYNLYGLPDGDYSAGSPRRKCRSALRPGWR